MLFCLHRRDVARAHEAQTLTRAINVGTPNGPESARAMEHFLAEHEELIAHDPFAPADPGQPTREELAFFEKMDARARAATRRQMEASTAR